MKNDTISAPAIQQIEAVDVTKPVDTAVLEQRATEARERLLQAVDALDKKRHALTQPGKPTIAGGMPAAIIAGALIAAGSITAFSVTRRRRRPLIHLARHRPEPSFLGQVAKHVGLTLITFAMSEGGKFALQKWMPTKAGFDAQRDQARRP